jgi:divalent metal cation (Fe/Co/Zn/Cd) transporter
MFEPMATIDVHASLVRRGKLLEYATIAYNLLEGLIAVGAGIIAGSIALVGFGVDSAIEVFASLLLVWRLHMGERTEKRALQLVGVSFLLLAAYVAFDAGKALYEREAPRESIVGIVLAAASVAVMPLLVRAKRRVADAINSRAMHAEATQTQLCMYLSVILLVGLGLNAALGWWWADPVAALGMTPFLLAEGREAWRGEDCDCH